MTLADELEGYARVLAVHKLGPSFRGSGMYAQSMVKSLNDAAAALRQMEWKRSEAGNWMDDQFEHKREVVHRKFNGAEYYCFLPAPPEGS